MSSGGGKGGSDTSKTEVPDWIKQPAMRNLARAESMAQVGYMPYYGPDVAAFTPMQEAAAQSVGNSASAFGMVQPGFDAMAGMGTPDVQADGMRTYSSGGLFDQALAELEARRPGQAQAQANLFIDPQTGAPARTGGTGTAPPGLSYMPYGF